MIRGFHIQVRSIQYDIWVIPDRYDWREYPKRSTSVSELVSAIHAVADERTLSFALNVRIVTDDGEPVSRWKVWPGRVKKLRRRY